MKYEAGYKNLNVWVKSNDLAFEIYSATKAFPKEELFGLVSQMRRCAVSVPANITEGYGRRTSKDKLHFFYIARGSLNELEYYLDFSLRLGFLDAVRYERLNLLRSDTGKLLSGFIKSYLK